MQILLIEDEERIAAFVRRGLEAEGFRVDHAADGETGLRMALREGVDLVILDLKLPALPGEAVLDRLRAQKPAMPVIILSAKDAIADRVRNLNSGADDYVTKPFSFTELLARVHARLRSREQVSSAVVEFGGVTLDLRTRQARVDGRWVELTSREFSLLDTFMRNGGHVLSQIQLIDRVWGYDFDPGSNVVEVYVGYLRRKLGAHVIETVRGIGYRFRG